MMRTSADPAAAYYAALVTPSNGLAVQWRSAQGGATNLMTVTGTAPSWVRVQRWTDSTGSTPVTWYSALTSPDGKAWATVPGSAVALSLPASYLDGIAVTSHDTSALSAVTLSGVAVGIMATEPPGVCTAQYTCSDVGGATPAGTQVQGASAWTVKAGGGDIWGTADQLRLVALPLTGDGSASAHVASITAPNGWAKAGVVLRADATAGAAYYGVFVTPSNGLDVQYRTAAGATTTQVLATGFAAPLFVRVTRAGTTFTAATSTDGTTWTAVPGAAVTLPGMPATLLAGLALTSHDTTRLATARFDTVSL